MARSGQYASDRWVTPGVIITALLVAGGVVSSVVGAVAYLTARGIDPDPLLKLAATLVGAVGSVGTFVLQLAQRTTAAKTERNTGVLVGVVDELAAAVPAIAPAPAAAPPREPAYVVNLDDDDGHPETQQRVTVPPIPTYPRHKRSHQA
jgi:hypothetical protein